MKKLLLISTLCGMCFLCACTSNSAKEDAAQEYCNSTSGTLTTSGDLYICSYDDGTSCESEDFRNGGCVTIMAYNENSWKEIISDDCNSFYDGCNNCEKGEDGEIACTEMACETYTRPLCHDIETEEGRIGKCEEKTYFYLNLNEADITWEEESEAGASFARNGHVVYTKRDGKASEDVFCFIDMVDGSVNVEFSNHEYLGPVEGADDECYEYDQSWEDFVNEGILLSGESCFTHTFYSHAKNACMGAYNCSWTEDSEPQVEKRSGIENLSTEERMLTCFESAGEQGVGIDETIDVKDDGTRNCAELAEAIELSL